MTYAPILESMNQEALLPNTNYSSLEDAILRKDNPTRADRTGFFYNNGVFGKRDTDTFIQRYELDATHSEANEGLVGTLKRLVSNDFSTKLRPEARADTVKGLAEVTTLMEQKYENFINAGGALAGAGVLDELRYNLAADCNAVYGCEVEELTFETVYETAMGRRGDALSQRKAKATIGLTTQETARIVDDMEYKVAKGAVTKIVAENYSTLEDTVENVETQIIGERKTLNKLVDLTEYVRGTNSALFGRTIKNVLIYGGAAGKAAVAVGSTIGAGVGAAPVFTVLAGVGMTYVTYKAAGTVGSYIGSKIGGEFSKRGNRRAAKLGARLGGLAPLTAIFGPGLITGALLAEGLLDYTKELASDKVIEHKHKKEVSGEHDGVSHNRNLRESSWYITKEISKLFGNVVVAGATGYATGAWAANGFKIEQDPKIKGKWLPSWIGDDDSRPGPFTPSPCDSGQCIDDSGSDPRPTSPGGIGDIDDIIKTHSIKDANIDEVFYHHCTLNFAEPGHERALALDSDFSGGHINSFTDDHGHACPEGGPNYTAGTDALDNNTLIRVEYYENGRGQNFNDPTLDLAFEINDGKFDFGDSADFIKNNHDNIQITWEKVICEGGDGDGYIEAGENWKLGALASITGDNVPRMSAQYALDHSATDCGGSSGYVPPSHGHGPSTGVPTTPPCASLVGYSPDGHISFDTNEFSAGDMINLNYRVADTDGDMLRGILDFNNNGLEDTGERVFNLTTPSGLEQSSRAIDTSYFTPGEHSVQMLIYDAKGNIGQSNTINYTVLGGAADPGPITPPGSGPSIPIDPVQPLPIEGAVVLGADDLHFISQRACVPFIHSDTTITEAAQDLGTEPYNVDLSHIRHRDDLRVEFDQDFITDNNVIGVVDLYHGSRDSYATGDHYEYNLTKPAFLNDGKIGSNQYFLDNDQIGDWEGDHIFNGRDVGTRDSNLMTMYMPDSEGDGDDQNVAREVEFRRNNEHSGPFQQAEANELAARVRLFNEGTCVDGNPESQSSFFVDLDGVAGPDDLNRDGRITEADTLDSLLVPIRTSQNAGRAGLIGFGAGLAVGLPLGTLVGGGDSGSVPFPVLPDPSTGGPVPGTSGPGAGTP